MSSVGALASSGIGSKEVICLETLNGVQLKAYVYQEAEEPVEIPGLLNPSSSGEKHKQQQPDLTRILEEIRKPEKEEALPFELN